MARENGTKAAAPPSAVSAKGGSGKVTFMAAHPRAHGKGVRGILKNGHPTQMIATKEADKQQTTWQQCVSMFCIKLLYKCYPLLKFIGFVIEWTINFVALNNGPFSLLYRLCFFKWGNIIIPQQDADNYYSVVGQLDPRVNLYVDKSPAGKETSTQANTKVFPDENVGSRPTGDVCVMAAKLAYENEAMVKKVVEQNWQMHFVGFYNCWNEYQKMKNTQVFVFMDKAEDANAVVVAWRGTEAFNAYDWSTDIDFSWVKFPNGMGVHLGFLEALGLGTRENMDTFSKMQSNVDQKSALDKEKSQQDADAANVQGSPHPAISPHHKKRMSEINATKPTSGLAPSIIADPEKMLGYDDITHLVATLLHDNPKAKLFVTGHSLGGALAALYSTLLHWNKEVEITDRMAAVYTFGQPRVGDEYFANYATKALGHVYYRVVYCNDLVPRVPFDNEVFAYKHLGDCAYFNSVYDGLVLKEAPNRNYFGFSQFFMFHFNAVWELFQSLVIATTRYGADFRESSTSILFRMLGLVLPGVASHSPCNYVNSVRLGPFPLAKRLKGDIADLAEEVQLMEGNVKDILYVIFSSLPALPGKDVWEFAYQKFFHAVKS